jgi:hypothetical protein
MGTCTQSKVDLLGMGRRNPIPTRDPAVTRNSEAHRKIQRDIAEAESGHDKSGGAVRKAIAPRGTGDNRHGQYSVS